MNQRIRKLALLLGFCALVGMLGAAPARAACSSLGGGRYYCASTGDADADGSALWNLLNDKTFPCGSTIILEAGASYNTTVSGGYNYGFRLKPQTGCSGHTKTQIISSRLAELPEGRRVTWDDRPKTARLVAKSWPPGYGGLVIDLFGTGVNNWALRGVTFTTGPGVVSAGGYGSLVTLFTDLPTTSKLSDYTRDLEFDRCMFYPYEEEQYGPMETASVQAAFFRGIGMALNLTGRDITVKESLFKGIGGYNPASPTSVSASSATQASPAVVTANGIASTFGLSNGAGCSTGCTSTCIGNGGCRVGVFEGATGDWSTLNGAKQLVYDSANTVKVYAGDSYYAPDPTPYNSAGKGALTGTVTIRRGTAIDPVYAILAGTVVNLDIVNNFLEGWSMTVFTGGGTFQPTDYSGLVQAGSTASEIILDNVASLQVGDLIMAPAEGRSVYCTSPAKGCWWGGTRVGKVTQVVGLTATVIPWGPTGIDVPPTTGGQARWRGNQVEFMRLKRNTIFRSDGHTLNGKGFIELKNCKDCLVDGNILTDSAIGNWFLTVRNQGGRDPWNTGTRLTFSNNLVGGTNGAPPRLTLQGEDDELTSTLSENAYYVNNVLPEIRFPNAATANPFSSMSIFDHGTGVQNSGWLHNTAIAKAGSSSHKGYMAGGCGDSPNPYGYGYSVALKDNIVSYGEGIDVTSCWVGQSGLVKNNLFWSDGTPSAAAIEATWSGNEAVEDISEELAGACNWANWESCKLKDDSTYRGAASDGGDPGADVEQVKDRLNGWSERAGLIDGWNRNRPGAIQPAGTKAVLDFKLIQGGACTVELYTDRNRVTLHADTTSAGDKLCGRMGNLVEGDRVVFVLGTVAALTAGTNYFYKITQGAAMTVGSFRTTADTARVLSVQVSDTAANNLVVEYSTHPDFSGSAMTDPAGFISGKASVQFNVSEGSAVFFRWRKRDGSNGNIATGGTQVAVGG